jgi:uncharacterized protein (DUF58 family)
VIPKELLQKIRRIQITSSRMVTNVFAGQYHSVFKGRGMEFDEVREYQPGDDIRSIDWNVTARTGSAHVKKFIEERELTVMILVDASMSCKFASTNKLKSNLAAEIAAVLAFSAINNKDKVGLIIFTDRIEKFIPPRKGLRHVLRIIREVLYFQPTGKLTNISLALEYLNKVMIRKSICFLISDYLDSNGIGAGPDNYSTLRKPMAIANKRHDVVAITLNDPREMELPNCGLLQLEDAETNELMVVDSSSPLIRKKYHEDALERLNKRGKFFRSVGVDYIDVETHLPYADALAKFFMKRKKRLHL